MRPKISRGQESLGRGAQAPESGGGGGVAPPTGEADRAERAGMRGGGCRIGSRGRCAGMSAGWGSHWGL